MNESNGFEMVPNEAVPHKELLQKWLRLLLYIQLAGIAVSALSLIPSFSSWFSWVSYLVTIGTFFVLFRLAPANGRYRTSAVLSCVSLFLTILNSLMGLASGALGIGSLLGSLFTLAASICTLVAAYQEYHGHADVIKPLDNKLSGKWHSLFTWQIIIGVVMGFGSSIAAVVSVLIGGALGVVSVIVVITGLAGICVRIVYLMYLNRTCKLLQA